MPNWTSNRICVTGEEADIRVFLEASGSQEQVLDFNRIIPMPDVLTRTNFGLCTIDEKQVSSWYVIAEGSGDGPDQVRRFTPEEETQVAEIRYSDWYHWSIAKWGTKWNARFSHIGDRRNGYVEIAFDTAWSAPVPVFRKMIAMFPRLNFVCRWMDEGDDRLIYLVYPEGDL